MTPQRALLLAAQALPIVSIRTAINASLDNIAVTVDTNTLPLRQTSIGILDMISDVVEPFLRGTEESFDEV